MDRAPWVAVAIVAGRLGVLVGRRRDGEPPLTFSGGKIENGESPETAEVRKTLEETGSRAAQARPKAVAGLSLSGISRVDLVLGIPPHRIEHAVGVYDSP